MELNIADAVVLGLLLVSGLLAYARGFVREVAAILGWLAAAWAGLYAAPLVEPLLMEVPVLSGLLASSCSLAKLAAFSVAFALALLVVSIFTPLLAGLVQSTPVLAPLDRAAGFVFGVARGAALVAVAWLVYDLVIAPGDRPEIIETAVSTAYIEDAAAAIRAATPDTLPDWIVGPADRLMAECGGLGLDGPPDPDAAPETAPAGAAEE